MADNDDALPSVFSFSSDVSSQEQPHPLPNGTYRGTIASVESKVSGKQNTYADIVVKVDPNQYPVDWIEGAEYPDGIALHYRRVVIEDSPSGRFRIRRFTEVAGLPKVGRELNLVDWQGRDVKVEVKAERSELDGLLYATIQKVLAA